MAGDDRDEPHTDRAAAGATALVVIDMISDMRFAGADTLLPAARRAAHAIRGLRDAADAAGVPVIYVNDNNDRWHSERSRLIARALEEAEDGQDIVRLLHPRDDDYFVIKPQFSGFYATNLPVLLPKLGASRLILTGMSADICVLFTAADAHMRDYALWVPEDTVAAVDPERTRWALDIMADSMTADVRPTTALALSDWLDDARSPPDPSRDAR